MTISPLSKEREEGPPPLEGDALLERTVQLYAELRLVKRPPESAPGAERKALRWLEAEACSQERPLKEGWRSELARAFLEVEGDVAEMLARRRHGRRPSLIVAPKGR